MRVRPDRTFGAIAAFGLAVVGCATKAAPPVGLELDITTNLTVPRDYNAFRVEVSQQTTTGTWNRLFNTSYAVPTQGTLPTTLAIAPGANPDQDALIRVTAYRGFVDDTNQGAVEVLREAQLQIPDTRVAALTLVLSARCINVLCTNPDQTCLPDTGQCGSSSVDEATLPTYQGPGSMACEGADCSDASSVDAGGDDSTIGAPPDASTPGDAGADSGQLTEHDAGTDASQAPDTGIDMRPDAAREASVDSGSDTGSTAHDANTDAPHDTGPADTGLPLDGTTDAQNRGDGPNDGSQPPSDAATPKEGGASDGARGQ
jgi:hypothetical protein